MFTVNSEYKPLYIYQTNEDEDGKHKQPRQEKRFTKGKTISNTTNKQNVLLTDTKGKQKINLIHVLKNI